jgi:hypothetical protein
MGGSIRACIHEKNRWSGKAMFTASQESVADCSLQLAACS